MTFLSTVSDYWLGLCPKAPVVRASQTGNGNQPEPAYEGRPDGGAGGSRMIRQGIGAALSGTKTLIRNRQLLWFPLLVGLVLAGHFIAQWVLYNHPYSALWPFYVDSFYSYLLSSLIQTFAVEFPTVFCMVFFLAGLALSLSPEKRGPASFFQGLTGAKKYLLPLAGWSVVVALAGTLLFTAGQYSSLLPTWLQPFTIIPPLWSDLWGILYYVLGQSPFNNVFYHPGFYLMPPGDAWGIMWAFKSAVTQTVILSAINLFLFVLTLFVVPLLVLERKSLKDAVSGSLALMKKIWGEVATCALGLGMVVFAVSFTYLFFPTVTGMLARDVTWRAGDEWIALGSLYMLALAGFVFVVATVGGIAALELYTSAKTRHMAGSADTEPSI
jgi:hypothetical protein